MSHWAINANRIPGILYLILCGILEKQFVRYNKALLMTSVFFILFFFSEIGSGCVAQAGPELDPHLLLVLCMPS